MKYLLLLIPAVLVAVPVIMRVLMKPYYGSAVRVFKTRITGFKSAYINRIIKTRGSEDADALPTSYSCCFMLSPDKSVPRGEYYRWFRTRKELYYLGNRKYQAYNLKPLDKFILKKTFRLY